jgi:hypothetical protein
MHFLPANLLWLLPVALATPIQRRDEGCTAASFGDFKWTLSSFDYHASYIFTTPAHQNSWGYVNFNLTNPALPYPAVCSASSSQLSEFFYGNQDFNCSVPEGKTGEGEFTFDLASGKLDFDQGWTCDDVDPQYPITFHGYGTVNVTLNCTDTTYTNPNWTMGQIYSDREVKCAPVTLPVEPYQITAVA